MSKIKKLSFDFFFELYENKNILNPFQNVSHSNRELKTISKKNHDYKIEGSNKFFSVFFIPDYFTPQLDYSYYAIKKVSQFFRGYAIDLKEFKTVDEYLKFRFRSNAKAIRKKVRRLDTCFTIDSKFYYGTISKEKYDFYMSCLYKMLVSRFEQRNDVNLLLLNWQKVEALFFSLINEKKASLFVISEEQRPIVISLSHHYDGHLFSAISSYDINFSKFSLGTIEIYKKLEWCLLNDHFIYEMGMGDLTYKKEWCNHIYNFEHTIIYPKKGLIIFIQAHIEFIKISLKEAIYKLCYKKYKEFKEKRKKQPTSSNVIVSEAIEINTEKELIKLNIYDEAYDYIRTNIYDFCYFNSDHIKNITLFESVDEPNTFIIQGKSKMQQLQFKK
tara:strand:- start:15793 stop:16953 length:1161 start_codon:yes stop_codon:yes gene_type:complete